MHSVRLPRTLYILLYRILHCTVKSQKKIVQVKQIAMATTLDADKFSVEHKQTEDVAEKTSHSSNSGRLEAQNVDYDDAEAARVLRKVDMRLVPMLALLYLVAFIDRSNSTYRQCGRPSRIAET